MGEKVKDLSRIAASLKNIHDNGLIHQDFHCGNILNGTFDAILIADLGLCQPANVKSSQSDNKQIFGVLPYVAPEVLRGKDIHKQVIFMDLELLHMKSLQDYLLIMILPI